MKKRFIVLGLLFVTLTFISYLWWNQAIKPLDLSDRSQIPFVITRGENVKNVANRLSQANLIRSKLAFYLYIRINGISTSIQSGDFILSPSMNLTTIASTLTHGTFDTRITIPEGWRNEEIALKLSKELSIPESEFIKIAKIGFMFPDTYLIPKDASASSIVTIFLNNFDQKIASIDKQKLTARNLSLSELITIASLVEREARFDEDRKLIASVILNRLKIGMKLDVDASVQYALGYQSDSKTWWKKNLTLTDINIDSQYNTYKYAGLPPTSISNPGMASIEAVINAPSTNYLYYVADSNGKSYFAQTLAEHNTNIIKYLNK